MVIVSNKTFLFTAFPTIPLSSTIAYFGTAFSKSSKKRKIELFENVPVIIHHDVHNAFHTLSHIVLDVVTAEISPQQTACLQLIESIGQVFGLLNCCLSHQCIQSDELIYQTIKMTLSSFFSHKTHNSCYEGWSKLCD